MTRTHGIRLSLFALFTLTALPSRGQDLPPQQLPAAEKTAADLAQRDTTSPKPPSPPRDTVPNLAVASIEELMNIKVTTASLVEESVFSAPAMVRVITKQQIRDRGYRNLLDLIEDLPAFDVAVHNNVSIFDRVTIRGVTGNDKFLIMQNGIRITPAANTPYRPIADNYPLYYAKQVEILYGPASALYGADAVTGIINIITEEPQDGLTTTIEPAGFRGQVYGGKKINNAVSLSIGAHYDNEDRPDLSKFYPSLFKLNDLRTLDGKVAVRAQDRRGYQFPSKSYSSYGRLDLGHSLTFGFTQSYLEHPTTTGQLPSAVDYGANSFRGYRSWTLYGKYKLDVSKKLSGQVQANYSSYELNPHSKFNNQVSGFRDAFIYERSTRVQIEPHFDLQWEKHILSAGLNFERYSVVPNSANTNKPFNTHLDPLKQDLFHLGTNDTLPVQVFHIDYTNIGGFLQAKSQWTHRFSTTAGVRFDHHSDYGSSVNPRVGLVLQASRRTTLRALYGRAFLAPAPDLRYEHFGSFTGVPNAQGLYESFFFRVPNPDLKPEELETVEFGVDHTLSKRLRASLSGYSSKVDGLILTTATVPVESGFIPGAILRFTDHNDNIGKLKAHGLDLIFDYLARLQKSRVNVWASFGLVNGDLTSKLSGIKVPLPFVSRQKVKLGATYNYRDQFVVTPTVYWIGKSDSFAINPSSRFFGKTAVPGYMLVNLYVERRNLWGNSSLFVRVTNLFNRRYYNPGSTGGFSFVQAPQEQRWVMVGITSTY